MTYYEHVRKAFLPKVIDEYVIMTAHADKLKIYLADEGKDDHNSRYYYNRMLSLIETYKEFLSKS